jgi:hypothetical protein
MTRSDQVAKGTEVYLSTENKALPELPPRTNVTNDFGEASANIKPDCVIP